MAVEAIRISLSVEEAGNALLQRAAEGAYDALPTVSSITDLVVLADDDTVTAELHFEEN